MAVVPQFNMWPLTPLHNAPRGLEGLIFVSQLCPFTCRRICIRVPNLFTIGPAVWHLSNIFEFVTPKPPSNVPWGSRGYFFSPISIPWWICRPIRVPSLVLIGPGFGSFPRFVNWWPPNPLGYQGANFYLMSIPRWICIRVPNLVWFYVVIDM